MWTTEESGLFLDRAQLFGIINRVPKQQALYRAQGNEPLLPTRGSSSSGGEKQASCQQPHKELQRAMPGGLLGMFPQARQEYCCLPIYH